MACIELKQANKSNNSFFYHRFMELQRRDDAAIFLGPVAFGTTPSQYQGLTGPSCLACDKKTGAVSKVNILA